MFSVEQSGSDYKDRKEFQAVNKWRIGVDAQYREYHRLPIYLQ